MSKITKDQANKLYKENRGKEFTDLATLYKDIENAALVGVSSTEVYIDSRRELNAIKEHFEDLGFSVTVSGSDNIITLYWSGRN